MMLNARERFLRVMHYKKTDRVPFCEFIGFWGETVNRWYKEGLPSNVGLWTYQLPIGLGNPPTIFDYFGFDKVGGPLRAESCVGDIPIDFGPIPRFIPKTLREDERYRVEVDESGITKKVLKQGVSMPGFIDFPVKNRRDFEAVKERFNPDDPRRYPKTWDRGVAEHYETVEHPVGVGFPGFFGQPRSFMGLENLLKAFYLNPELVREILDFWSYFVIETLRKTVETVKVDYANVWEDMSYRSGPLISPTLFRKFLLPYYKKVTGYLRKHGVDIIMVDTDGNHDALTPLFLEGGVNCIYPLEVASGMDAPTLRTKYGRTLRLIGNIDKGALTRSREAVEQEVERVRHLISEGGYIPSIDHAVPQDVSLENYTYYVSLLRKYLET